MMDQERFMEEHSHKLHLLFVSVLLITLVACTGAPPQANLPTPQVTAPLQPSSPPPEQPTPAVEEPVTVGGGGNGVATLAYIQDFDSLNPLFAQALSSIYTQPVYNCRAWYFDDQNNPIPVLVKELPSAKNGGVSEDGKTITLKLRDDIVWSDGTPITAQDFIFTYQMIISDANALSNLSPYDLLEAVEAPDPQTVVVRFKAPYAPWLSALWQSLLPAHVLQPVFDSQGSIINAEWNRAPSVGCGPFVFESWDPGKSARFVANDKYWLGRPKLAAIEVKFYADDAAKAQALKDDQAHLAIFLTNAISYVPDLKGAGVKILPVNSGYNEGWFFFLDPTQGQPALQDERVRQALAYAVDRQRLLDEYLGGLPSLIATYWDNTPYVASGIKPWPYDPEKARALLDEAGWVDSNASGTRDKDGVELELTYGTTVNEARQAVQKAVQTMLADVGVRVELAYYDSATFFLGYNEGGPVATGQMDIFEYAPRTKNYPDPGTNDFLCSQIPTTNELGENWSWLCDQELDQLLQLQASQMDFAERQKTFQKISQIVYDKVYFLGFWSDPDIWAASPRLLNVRLSGVEPLYNVAEWDVSP
jgi:peptide/nickel transport system substrate-binding protein